MATALMIEPETTTAPAPELSALLESHHQLAARVAAAEVALSAAQGLADAADRQAGDAVVGGDADTMRQADDAADVARATLVKARRNALALQRAHDALRPQIEGAMTVTRQAVMVNAMELLRQINDRFRVIMLKASALHQEAVAVAYTAGHPAKDTLPLLSLPSCLEYGAAPLYADGPHQGPPELPRGALALADAVALLRDADRVLHPHPVVHRL